MSKKILWLTTSSMNVEPVMNSLSAYNFDLEIVHHRYDEMPEGRFFDEALFLKVGEVEPDAVFYIGSLEGPFLPRPHVFKDIKNICPIVHFVFDGACPLGWPTLKKFREEKCFTSTVNIDGSQDWPKGPNDLTIVCPVDPRPYQRPYIKSVPLGFYGGVDENRAKVTRPLEEAGLLTTAKRNETLGSYQAYADFMLNCHSVLNIAGTGSAKAMHVKARVIEAGLSHSCLLEPKGSPTKNWLRPGIDYLEYANQDHLLTLVKDLREAPSMARSYAEHLNVMVTTELSAERSYLKIFDKIGLGVSKK